MNSNFMDQEDDLIDKDNQLIAKLLSNQAAESPVPPVAPAAKEEGGLNLGVLGMQGLAGLGDAITGAFGTNKTNFTEQAVALPGQLQKQEELKVSLAEKKRKQGIETALAKTLNDPTSTQSLARQEQARKLGLFKDKDLSKFTAAQLDKVLGDQFKIADIDLKKESNRLSAENRDATRDATAAYRDQQNQFQREKFEVSQGEKADKRTQELEMKNRLDDKDVETVTAFEDAKRKMKEATALLGNNTNWTGPVDGRIPDAMVGDDQVRFRAEMGKLFDQYRKAITGAGAGPSEMAMLLKRLPTENDTFDNFRAKADSFINDSDESLKSFLANKQKQGKNVSKFVANGENSPEKTIDKKSSNPAPGGNIRIRQNGVEYQWDGSEYVETPTMARR